MNQFKIAQVIMLPTNNKSHIYHVKINNILGYVSGKLKSDLEQFPNQTNTQNQHLYITSDDKIEDNDWCINENNNIFQYIGGLLLSTDKKIIATTDTSLKITKSTVGYTETRSRTFYSEELLPQPSQQFIEKYIESYNKGEVITDALVEYNYLLNDNEVIPYLSLKINPKDNTTSIKKLKDNWNRGEVIELFNKFGKDTKYLQETYSPELDLKHWIEENL